MSEIVTLRCTSCHKPQNVNTNNSRMYSDTVIIDNFVCPLCMGKSDRIKIVLVCAKCNRTFQTRVFKENADKYTSNWLCPACVNSSNFSHTKHKKLVEVGCQGCNVVHGLCLHPELNCVHSKNYAPFDTADLYSDKKQNKIMFIHDIDKSRDDIHSLKFIVMYKKKYSVSNRGVVLIKQRIGSKKNFTTNIILYKSKEDNHGVEVVYDKSFKKCDDWIVPTRNKIMSLMRKVR